MTKQDFRLTILITLIGCAIIIFGCWLTTDTGFLMVKDFLTKLTSPENELELVCFSFISILLILITILRLIAIRIDAKSSFVYSKRTKKMNWSKLGRYWLVTQFFSVILKWGSISNNILFVFGLPIILMFILIVYVFSYDVKGYDDNFDQIEYESYKKAFDRDKKLRKII